MQNSDFTESENYIGLKEAAKDKLSITDQEIEAVNFVFWLICTLEKEIFTKVVSESISGWAKISGMKYSDEFMLFIFEELSLMGKIKIMEKGFELYGPGNPGLKPFLSFFRELNDIRNQIAHFKFTNLQWRGREIKDEETKSLMINEFYSLAKNFSEGGIHQKSPYN